MILVDTSVWVNHLRAGDAVLAAWLDAGMVLTHPFIIGELALGNLRQRNVVLSAFSTLPRVNVATDEEALRFIESHDLPGCGIGYVDLHLLAAVRLTAGSQLWSKDKRLRGVAARLGLAFTVRQPAKRSARSAG